MAKLKILYLYDYFMHQADPSDETGITVQEMIDMLYRKTGETFERKSIYADISRINEYVAATRPLVGQEFIFHDGKRYFRGELKDELMLDEARLISDSLRTTEFVPENIYRKFETMFPAFFNPQMNTDAVRLYSRHLTTSKTANSQMDRLLSFIRQSITEASPIRFRYGYKVTSSVVGSVFIVTPLMLDWTNDHYYLIAIDNVKLFTDTGFEKAVSNKDLAKCIKRFRLDRIDRDFAKISNENRKTALRFITDNLPDLELTDNGEEMSAEKKNRIAKDILTFHGFSSEDEKNKNVTAYIDKSFEGYSSVINATSIRMSIEARDKNSKHAWKNVLQAFSVFRDEFTIQSGSIRESETDKKISFTIEAPNVPPLYKFLFSMYTFTTVRFEIENEEIRNQFREYLTGALESLQ